jgi:hypothetical protein
VITNSGEILHAPTADENYGMFLEVMTDARNICSHFDTIGETYTSNLA